MQTWLQKIVLKESYMGGNVPRSTGGHDDGGNNLAPGSSNSLFGGPVATRRRKRNVHKKKYDIGQRPGE